MWLVLERPEAPGSWLAALPLPEGEVFLGRDPTCAVVLNGRRVSRHHVQVVRRGAAVSFRDLESTVGVLLNGVRTAGGDLAPGDRLALPGAVVRLESVLPAPVEPPEPSESLVGAAAWAPFQAFVESLRRAGEPRALLERLLQGLLALLEAERGFVVLREEPGGPLVPVAMARQSSAAVTEELSRTICRRAMDERLLVHVPDTSRDPSCDGITSLMGRGGARSLLCAPLEADGQSFGALYLDQPARRSPWPEASLGAVETVTGLASQFLAADRTRAGLVAARGRLKAMSSLLAEGDAFVPGASAAGRRLEALVTAAAAQDVSVLVAGETGTGKEMVVRELHRRSPRRDGPFVAVNAASLPRELIEAELFGVEPGAFTGAAELRLGRFELAAGGTLFLDEVGELPADVQVKLLRVLQERVLMRLGSSRAVPLDFRLVCATNADLEAEVAAGSFRRDLFFRINVFRLDVPPLRDRREDVVPLARHFLATLGGRLGRHGVAFAPDAERLMEGYPWPGNVRELRNAVERALVVTPGPLVPAEGLPIGAQGSAGTSGDAAALESTLWRCLPADYGAARDAFDRTFLKRSLAHTGGNVKAVARATGVPRSTLYRRMEKLGLLPPGGDE